jgi:non-heme chloroperoxidase
MPPRILRVVAVALSVAALLAGVVPRAGAEPASSVVTLPSGVTLHYVVQGDPAGEVVVLLHGAGDSWHSYDLVYPLLPASYRVYGVTLRGHGWSDHPSSGYAREDFAADITAFLAALDLKGVTLVGHSLGSFAAQVVAQNDSARRLKRLVLVGSGPGGPKDEKSREELRAWFAAVKEPIDHVFARDFQASTAYNPVPAGFFETMCAEVQRVPAHVWHALGATLGSAAAVERLSLIAVPTLILWGDKDGIVTRADQEVLTSRIPKARLVAYANTGHALHWEKPAEFARDLLAFLRER